MQTEYDPVYHPFHLDHIERLTDDTGIMQHATFSVPDPRHGYSIDDQARALMVVLAHTNAARSAYAPKAAYTYTAYLQYAATQSGWFHNFLSFGRAWLDERGSDDCYGRAMWALGYAQRFGVERGLTGAAAELFSAQARQLESLTWPRSQAFALFGLYHRLQVESSAYLLGTVHVLANQLADRFDAASSPDWLWFEDTLTYCNAKLPAALLLAFELTGNARYLKIGTTALRWLSGVVFEADGELRLVGQDGWYPRGGAKAAIDEQCVDAQGIVEAAIIAERVTGDSQWRQRAVAACDWFLGRNVHRVSLVDPETWGCYDGITRTHVNNNMGAESTLCYLLAYLALVEVGALTLEGAVPQPTPAAT